MSGLVGAYIATVNKGGKSKLIILDEFLSHEDPCLHADRRVVREPFLQFLEILRLFLLFRK